MEKVIEIEIEVLKLTVFADGIPVLSMVCRAED